MVQRIGVRVGYKVHRLVECNKNKRKTNEERWHVTQYGGGRGAGRLCRRFLGVGGHWHWLML